MPVIDVHLMTSARRTGKEYRAVHEFVDTPGKKDERHDIKKIHEFGEMFRKSHIYADRLVDIIMDGMVKTEPEAEERFEAILSTNTRYGKNEATL